MNSIIVRDVIIGEGIPKICIPIVGITKEEILKEARELRAVEKDLVEWRVDWFEGVFDLEQVREILGDLRELLGDCPIIFTFRTTEEGGEKTITDEQYEDLLQSVVMSGSVDLIDVEIFHFSKKVEEIVRFAHEHQVYVLASNHHFTCTPSKEEIVERLRTMQHLGADVLKIAVMPQNTHDVLMLLEATDEMREHYARRPIVTMSMGNLGVLSRVCGEIFGSAITFGAATKASAPGQIAVDELKCMLDILHKNMGK